MKPTPGDDADSGAAGETIAALLRRNEQLQEERDFLLAHSRNLEGQLRSHAIAPGVIRDLEQRLAHAEGRLRRVSVVGMGTWVLLNPRAALRRMYRRLSDGILWRIGDRQRRLRIQRPASRA